MNITLDERLFTCAEFVRENSVLADVGTDHAYLPAFLLKQGKIRFALCCDINEKPLESAKATVKEYGVANRVKLYLCDGLSGVEKDEFSDLVIAGMGGEMIIKILTDCPYIKDEKAAESNNKIYTVINAVFCGKAQNQDEKYYYFGEFLRKNDEK